jgi:hypothetical protein
LSTIAGRYSPAVVIGLGNEEVDDLEHLLEYEEKRQAR